MKIDLNYKYSSLVKELNDQAPFEPEIALVLGSGLGDFADAVEIQKSVPSNILPGYPQSQVEGHKNYIHFAKYKGKSLLLFQGRIHFYEGFKLSECVLPVHIAKELGVKKLLLTNAAGGINPNFSPGDLMLIRSVYSFNIKKELTGLFGVASVDEKNNFINFPSKKLNEQIINSALMENIYIREGSYWFSTGPSYESKAEIKMMQKFGVDAVGMSTVHEAIYGAVNGLETSAVSCITNLAAGISQQKLSHAEVIETADLVKDKFERLVKRFIANL